MAVPFGPWRPDLGETEPGIVLTADNVLIQKNGYGPRKSFAAAPGAVALTAPPRGAVSVVLDDGGYTAFIATADDLYEMDAGYDFDSLGATLTVASDDDVSFLHFGDFLLLSDTATGMQAYNVETPAGVGAVSGAPAARVIFHCANTVVALGDGTDLKVIRNSAYNDHTKWKGGGADYQPLEDGEDLSGGCDLSNGRGLVLQRNAVRLMTFGAAGGGAQYALTKLSDGVGCVHPRSLISWNGMAAWRHTNGFYMSDGARPVSISSEKMEDWFQSIREPGSDSKIYGSVDPVQEMFWWRFKSTSDGSDTVFTRLLGFNYRLMEWVTATETTAALFRMATPGYSLEDLDTFGTLETLPYSLDSRFWSGGAPNLAALNGDLKFGFFDGANAAARVESASVGGQVSRLYTWATPVTDAENATVRLGVKDRLADAIAFKPAVAMTASGRCPIRGRGKYARFRVDIPAGEEWDYLRGVSDEVAPSGGPK